MAKAHVTVEVDGVKYLIQHPSPTEAWKIGVELTKLIGEPVALMSSADDKDDSKTVMALQMAMKGFMGNLDPDASLSLIKRILIHVQVQSDGTLLDGAAFDLHFRGRMGAMMKVIGHAVEFQFTDFFGAIGDAIAGLMKKTPKGRQASQSQIISAGQS